MLNIKDREGQTRTCRELYVSINDSNRQLYRMIHKGAENQLNVIELFPFLTGDNDEPVMSLPDDITYVIGSGKKNIGNNLIVDDPELNLMNNYGGCRLVIKRVSESSVYDRYSFDFSDTDFAINGLNILHQQEAIAQRSDNLNELDLTFLDGCSGDVFHQLIQTIEYQHVDSNTSATAVVLDVTVSDGNTNYHQGDGGEKTVTQQLTINMRAGPTNILAYAPEFSYGDLDVVEGNFLVPVVSSGNNGSQFGSKVVFSSSQDDDSTAIDLTSVFTDGINLFGTTFSSVYVGINGYITFGHRQTGFSPLGISGYSYGNQAIAPLIAAQYDDIDLRPAPGQSPDGTSSGTHSIYYHLDPENRIATFTWDDTGAYNDSSHYGDKSIGNAFQIRLHQLANNNLGIEIRYESISWAGGNSATYPTAGWTAGDKQNFGEIPGSGTEAFMEFASRSNIGQPGVYVWVVNDGQAEETSIELTRDTVAGTLIAALETVDPVDGMSHSYSLLDDSQGRFTVKYEHEQWGIYLAPGIQLSSVQTQELSIRVRSTNTDGLSIERMIRFAVLD